MMDKEALGSCSPTEHRKNKQELSEATCLVLWRQSKVLTNQTNPWSRKKSFQSGWKFVVISFSPIPLQRQCWSLNCRSGVPSSSPQAWGNQKRSYLQVIVFICSSMCVCGGGGASEGLMVTLPIFHNSDLDMKYREHLFIRSAKWL
jgi:hypothetical protein